MTRLAAQAPHFDFQAGQYLCVVHPKGTQIPLSIASAPWQLPKLELIYRTDGTSDAALAFDELLQANTELQLDGPFGQVTLSQALSGPRLRLIAAGTGIAQVLSVASQLQHLHQQQPARYALLPTQVFWANRTALAPTAAWLQQVPWLQVQHCHSDSLFAHLQTDFVAHPQAFNLIAGTPDFAYAVQDQLLALGCPLAQMAADPFDYAPR